MNADLIRVYPRESAAKLSKLLKKRSKSNIVPASVAVGLSNYTSLLCLVLSRFELWSATFPPRSSYGSRYPQHNNRPRGCAARSESAGAGDSNAAEETFKTQIEAD